MSRLQIWTVVVFGLCYFGGTGLAQEDHNLPGRTEGESP